MTASTNLDLVRSICAAQERGDYSSAEWAHPKIEFVIADGPSPGRWAGLAAMAESTRDFMSAWNDFRTEATEFRALDDERVLVLTEFRGRGKSSGVDVGDLRAQGARLYQVRGGKVTRFVTYLDRDRALADLGLASEAKSPDTERPR